MRTVELRAPGGARLRCRLADRFASRFVGLMGRRGLPEREGLLLVPGGSVHTFFMRFRLDVVFVDAGGTVLGVAEAVRPWRLRRAPRATRFVLEVGAGGAGANALRKGAQLELEGGWARLARRRLL